MICSECGEPLPEGSSVCSACGGPVAPAAIPGAEASAANPVRGQAAAGDPSYVDTGGGAAVTGNVDTGGGELVGGDKSVFGDEVDGDKVARDKVSYVVNTQQLTINQGISTNNQEISTKRQFPPRQAVRPPAGYVARSDVECNLRDLITAPGDEFKRVLLTGLPGSGVTSVAQAVAFQLEAGFPDGTLWTDLQTETIQDALWGFIEAYDQTLDRATLHNDGQYLEALRGILGELQVLIVLDNVQSPAEVNAISPDNCRHVVMLITSRVGLPGLVDKANVVNLPEMTPEEAEQLFRGVWSCDPSLLDTPKEVILELAQAHHFLPTTMAIAARDILTTQKPPQEYLDDLCERPKDAAEGEPQNNPAYGAIYERLPQLAQQILPFIGIFGSAPWDGNSLVEVSSLSRHDVELGLAQLKDLYIVNGKDGGPYSTSSVIRDFALSKLREWGGDPLLNATSGVRADHYLRVAGQFIVRHRQLLLDDYLSAEDRRQRFARVLKELIMVSGRSPGQDDESDSDTEDEDPVTIDLLSEAFERVVLGEPSFLQRWVNLMDSDEMRNIRLHLAQSLDWAIERENWPLARRFADLGSTPSMIPPVGNDRQPEISPKIDWACDFRFIRNARVTNANLVTHFKATRIQSTTWADCGFMEAVWSGVQICDATFKSVNMDEVKMPGLAARNCIFRKIDARKADWRGAVFFRCTFEDVILWGANLDDAEFIECTFCALDQGDASVRRTKGLPKDPAAPN